MAKAVALTKLYIVSRENKGFAVDFHKATKKEAQSRENDTLHLIRALIPLNATTAGFLNEAKEGLEQNYPDLQELVHRIGDYCIDGWPETWKTI